MATEEKTSSATAGGPSGSVSKKVTLPQQTLFKSEKVSVDLLEESSRSFVPKIPFPSTLTVEYDPEGIVVNVWTTKAAAPQLSFVVKRSVESVRLGRLAVIFNLDVESVAIRFNTESERQRFNTLVAAVRSDANRSSVFRGRTEESSAAQYFQFYGYLSQQQNMMQDFIRTSTYQRAIISNLSDFKDKIVLDVGAGSGILSFFAQQAGAKRVYAVEASSIAKHAEHLVKANKLSHVIQLLPGKIEEIELPEKVDVIISEPMGYMLLNERMLETYLHAKKWLKPEGKMFPSRGDLHVAPFTDEALYMEQINKVNFWYQEYFHGVNLAALRDEAMKEYFRQPVVDTFDIRICMSKTQRHVIDFEKASESELHRIEIPLEFHVLQSGTVHGLAFWFDVAFIGTDETIWLSTAPTEPLTHWYQVRCLFSQPLFAKQGQVLSGRVIMAANMKQSYDVTLECQVVGTSFKSQNTVDLKNPYFRYTGAQPQQPPGENNASPSEMYWSQVDMQGARQAVNLVNGMIVDGLGHVSLDNTPMAANAANQQSHLNIHQGSIPSTGRKGTGPVMSAATSLPVNQLIGGGVAPTLVQQTATNLISSSASNGQQAQNYTQIPQQQHVATANHVMANGSGQNLLLADFMTPANSPNVVAHQQNSHHMTQQNFRQ